MPSTSRPSPPNHAPRPINPYEPHKPPECLFPHPANRMTAGCGGSYTCGCWGGGSGERGERKHGRGCTGEPSCCPWRSAPFCWQRRRPASCTPSDPEDRSRRGYRPFQTSWRTCVGTSETCPDTRGVSDWRTHSSSSCPPSASPSSSRLPHQPPLASRTPAGAAGGMSGDPTARIMSAAARFLGRSGSPTACCRRRAAPTACCRGRIASTCRTAPSMAGANALVKTLVLQKKAPKCCSWLLRGVSKNFFSPHKLCLRP
jgi:hypothetical protein